jgi:hypothetical protein
LHWIFNQKFKSTTLKLLSYEDIMLKTFVDISKSGAKELLIICGSPTEEQLTEAWEKIVIRNGKENGDFEIETYIEKSKALGKLISDYTLIRLHLLKCSLVIDNDSLKFLKRKKFNINQRSNEAYTQSIADAFQKSNSYLTYITAAQRDIESITKQKEKVEDQTIEEALAVVSTGLGFSVPEDVKLARFNGYKKILIKKSQKKEHGTAA